MSLTTKEVLDKYYETVNKGDWDSWLTCFDDHVVIDEQLAGHAEGIEVLRGGVEGLKKGYAKFLMHPQHMIVDGEKAAVIWKCEAESGDHLPINAPGANFFIIKNGKITYMSNHHDSVPFAPFTNYMKANS